MNWKTFLTLTALVQANFFVSPAQTYSKNVVGLVKITLKPGFNLIANPLIASDNTLGNLFKHMAGGVPGGTTVYKFSGGNFVAAVWDDLENKYGGEVEAAQTTLPGGGVYVLLTGPDDKVLNFIGEVPQGQQICIPIPTGYSILSSGVPVLVSPFGPPFAPAGGDTVFRFDPTTKGFAAFVFDELDNKYVPDLPVIAVGEAFFYLRVGSPTTWCRAFTVN